ncbi:transposase, partial [Bacillaceae bacterium S4-13-56]
QKYHFSGHVFESRYGAELLSTVEYELEVNKYIHLNPLRANMVERLEDYRWSSYLNYIGAVKDSLVSTERIYTFIPPPKAENYIKFLHAVGDTNILNVKETTGGE